jgi:hypothetical protein
MTHNGNWETLTDEEWQEYSGLVDQFALSKKGGDYLESDRIRKLLQAWQSLTSDDKFIGMQEKGEYSWSPIFEQQGEGSHRHMRIQKRIVWQVLAKKSQIPLGEMK